MRQRSKLKDIDVGRTLEVIDRVSERLNYIFCPKEIADTVEYTIRKCEMNGKDEEYFYLLLEDELEQSLMRAYINYRGEQNRLKKLAEQANAI